MHSQALWQACFISANQQRWQEFKLCRCPDRSSNPLLSLHAITAHKLRPFRIAQIEEGFVVFLFQTCFKRHKQLLCVRWSGSQRHLVLESRMSSSLHLYDYCVVLLAPFLIKWNPSDNCASHHYFLWNSTITYFN